MNNQEKLWKIARLVAVMLVVFLVAVSLKEFKAINYVGRDIPIMNTISVNGKGEALAIPNIATFSFSVTENAKTVVDAQTSATTKMNNILKTVRVGGVADKDIQTTSYNINPHYEYQNAVCSYSSAGSSASSVTVGASNGVESMPVRYCPPGKSVLTGYDVGQTIQVKLRDLNKAGAILVSIGSLGVENLSGLNFSVDDQEVVNAEARTKAIADAESKAKILAKQLGVSLVRITSFYESNNSPIPYYGMGVSAKAMMSDVAVPPAPEVPTGEQKVTSNVTITYEIQ